MAKDEYADLIASNFAHLVASEKQHLQRWLRVYMGYVGETTSIDELLRRVATVIQGLLDAEIELDSEENPELILAQIRAYDEMMIKRAKVARERNQELLKLARDNNAENVYELLEAAFNLGVASIGKGDK